MKIRNLLLAAAVLLVLLVATYANHFHNGFEFDDTHTIENNVYIRDLKNIPRFFTDARTHTPNPANQMYRPLLSTTFAIDYRLAGNRLDPFYFHLDSFAWYVLLLLFTYVFFRHIFDQARPHPWNGATALVATAFYGFHTANAETLNYIYARSDSFSTFWLLAAFVMYLKLPKLQWHGVGLYLVPLAIGLFVKQAVLIFPGLLYAYALLLEGGGAARDFAPRRLLGAGLRTALPSLLLCGWFFWFQDFMQSDTQTPGGSSRYLYLITQPRVMLHYVENFILPVQLAADTDWRPLPSILDHRFFIGAAFVGLMLGIAWLAARRQPWRPITFGILWFFIALLPTSSIIPFAEVTNDHRTFLPYIGLVMAVVWAGALYLYREHDRQPLSRAALYLVLAACGLLIGLHAAGARERNRVWHDSESLWHDVVEKSPKSGRAWMNYGLPLMARGDIDGAERCFAKTLELWPTYPYAFVNMGILKNLRGKTEEAERNFRTAIHLDPQNAESYYFYASFLSGHGRVREAIETLEKDLQLSPAHLGARHLLMEMYARAGDSQRLHALAADTLSVAPGDVAAQRHLAAQPVDVPKRAVRRADAQPTEGGYLDLSLEHYRQQRYAQSIVAAEAALRINPRSAAALNNICAAQNSLGRYSEGIVACEKALVLQPDFQLAKNNLAFARQRMKRR